MSRLRTTAGGLSTPSTLSVFVALLTLLLMQGSSVLQQTVITALIYLLATIGFSIFVGNSGVFSFGHVAFMIIGAYAASLLAFPTDQKQLLMPNLPHVVATAHASPMLSCILGAGVAALVAVVVSLPLGRMSGISAALSSFAVLGIVYVVVQNWEQLTNGVSGIAGLPTTTTATQTLVWVVVAIFAAYLFQTSAVGMRLKASREDEVAARAIGVGIHSERRLAFVVSAFFVGAAGGLYAQQLGTLTPSTIYLNTTFLIIAMLVVGGISSLSGAVLGSVFISIVSELLRRVEVGTDIGPWHVTGRAGMTEVGLGLIMLLVLLIRPEGLTRGRELRWPSPPRRRRGGAAEPDPPGSARGPEVEAVAAATPPR
jgi:branched-chain amino acid transport system permease protein